MPEPRPRDEVEAAYFTLLRAREELDALRRYEEFLAEEGRRLRRFTSEGEALAEAAALRLRRPLRPSEELITEAVRSRLAVIDDELGRVPDRLTAAEAFVTECEHEHDTLRRSA